MQVTLKKPTQFRIRSGLSDRIEELEQQEGDSKGKYNIESLRDNETIERLFKLPDLQIGKAGFQPDADKRQVEPESAE